MREQVVIKKSQLQGDLVVPPSKSMAHRAIICASLANGNSIIRNVSFSKDILATIDMCKAIGAKIIVDDNALHIYGRTNNKTNFGNCNESGSTLRFFIPIVKLLFDEFKLYGKDSLINRPLSEYEKIFGNDIVIKSDHVQVKGGIKDSHFEVLGNVSSQFISGLLFALPLLKYDTSISITGTIESKSYIWMTIDVLKTFGVNVEWCNNVLHIKGNQSYEPTEYVVEADFSQAAFFYVANALGSKINIKGLNMHSLQGDQVIVDLIKEESSQIDATNCPDLIPVLSIYCALRPNIKTRIYNVKRLRYKESDRVQSTCDLITSLGGKIQSSENEIIIEGVYSFHRATINTYNDHRIAMAAAIASLKTEGEITVNNPECVSKSYPNFWDEFRRLGGIFDEQ